MSDATKCHEVGDLKQQKFIFPTVPEIKGTKAECRQGWFLLEALRENSFHASPGFLGVLGLYMHHSNLRFHLHIEFSCLGLFCSAFH